MRMTTLKAFQYFAQRNDKDTIKVQRLFKLNVGFKKREDLMF